jgi:hypothetical protein
MNFFKKMVFTSVTSAILLAGCGMDNSNPLLGKWKLKSVEMGTTKIKAPVNGEMNFKAGKEITSSNGAHETFDIKKYTVTSTKEGSKIVIAFKAGESATAYVYDHGNKMKLQVGLEYMIYSRA